MGHHVTPDGKIYVDSDFLNSAQRVPGVEIHHMGFGEFYFDTPKGRVEADRMRGKDFPGQGGRSHAFYDDKGGTKAAEWFIEEAEKHHLSERMASLRSKVIRLASTMPKGSAERKALLDVLK